MTPENLHFLIEVVLLVAGFGATIATIKSDVRHLAKDVERIDTSTRRAHERLDQHITGGHAYET